MKSFLLLISVLWTGVVVATLPTVDLGYAVHQATLNSSGQFPYLNFSHIRYGEAPVGNRRFAAPVPPRQANRTINDGQGGVICLQATPAWQAIQAAALLGGNLTTLAAKYRPINASMVPSPDPRTSEDCLFLDVVVPVPIYNSTYAKLKRGEICDCDCNSTGAPVLVWLYGGGYVNGDKTGSGNPATLVARSQVENGTGIIYVALNYRLGMFGFLSGPTFLAEGGTPNAGLLDQRLAFQWIHDNIHLFGGDPNQVTVMGESAGGGSIMYHITAYGGKAPASQKPHFKRAIMQSPAHQPIPDFGDEDLIFSQTLGNASEVVGANVTVKSLDHLRSLSFKDLYLLNYVMVANSWYGGFTFAPVVDGYYVPALPGQLLASGHFNKEVDVIVGHNTDEGALFANPFIQTDAAYVQDIRTKFPFAPNAAVLEISQTLYPPIFNGTYVYTSELGRVTATIADFHIVCNVAFLNAAFENKSHSYLFSIGQGLHGDDVSYTFFNGDVTTSDEGLPVIAVDAAVWQNYLTSFALTGDPNERAGGPQWPVYGEQAAVLDFNATFVKPVVDVFSKERCAFWASGAFAGKPGFPESS